MLMYLRKTVFNHYLIWTNSIIDDGRLPFVHYFVIYFLITLGFFNIFKAYLIISLLAAMFMDFVLAKKERALKFSNFLKKNTSTKIFEIFGNPGEYLSAQLAGKMLTGKTAGVLAKGTIGVLCVDHLANKTGVYEITRFHAMKASGLPEGIIKETIIQTGFEKPSLLESIVRRTP